MAGAGYKLFATGDVLTAAQVNTYLNEQTVMVFADSAARTTALSGVLAEGMMSYLQDTDSVEVYDGSAWTAVGGGGSSPLTTKGDLYGFSTVDARVPIGTNGHVLTADSTESLGLKWAAPATGGGMTLLSTTSLTGASVTISTISQDYNTLVFDLEDVVPATDDVNLNIRLNGQTGSVYTELRSMDSSSGASAVATSLKIITAAGNNANDFCNVRLSIPNYTCAFYKYALVTGVYGNQNSDASPPHHSTIGAIGAYLQTTAVSSITFFFASGNFATGSVKLYGVK